MAYTLSDVIIRNSKICFRSFIRVSMFGIFFYFTFTIASKLSEENVYWILLSMMLINQLY